MLESVMICCDNSEHARNGDYYPTRHDAQVDAVHMIVGAKLNSNAESNVGFLSMAGRSPTVHVTPTRDDTKILAKLHKVAIGGTSDFIAGARIASLALKHRSNKLQHPRLIMFVSSPVEVEEKDLKKLAKDLRKNGVAVDIISVGENEANDELLQDFLKKIDEENCNFLSVPTGKDVCDSLRGTGILYDFDTGGGGGGGAGGFGGGMDIDGGGIGGVQDFSEYGGIDPSVDPELADVMRQSILEQQAQMSKMEEEVIKASLEQNTNANGDAMETEGDDTDAQLQAALGATTTTTTTSSQNNAEDEDDDEEEDEEESDDENEALQRALAISMAGNSESKDDEDDGEEDDEDDPEFMAGILANLPGIDKDSDKFKGILDDVKGDKKKDDEEKE